jgi:ATP-dependent helicase/nuclease subunit A
MNLTRSQQQAVDHRGCSLLVSASAGSGKTEVLARRTVALIADPQRPCAVERLLVVTFTRAAAAELRIRIARMLREQADKSAHTGLRDHLRRQEILVDSADIGTIDAWCGRLVRAHAAEIGVDPAFTVLSEEDAPLLRKRVLDELFTWIYSAAEPLAQAARDWLKRSTRPGDAFLRRFIQKLNQYRENLVEADAWLARQRELHAAAPEQLRADACATLTAALASECAFQHEQLTALLASPAANLSALLNPYNDCLAAWNGRLSGTPDQAALLAALDEIDTFKLRKPRGGLPAAAEALFCDVQTRWLKGRLQACWSRDEAERLLDTAPAAGALVTTLLGLEQRFHMRLCEIKRSQATYEFADVLRMALDLLAPPAATGPRTASAIAQRLQQRYEHVLVDEYQDTSPVQVEILRLATRPEPGRSNRFMVGDIKQSIYGFRQAEPRLFAELLRDFQAGRQEGAVQYLSDNFRSHASIVGALNRMFAMLFDRALGGTPFAPNERLRAARDEIANASLDAAPRFELHIIEQAATRKGAASDATDGSADFNDDLVPLERIEREAILAAERIHDLLRQGVQVPQRGPDEQIRLRPLRLADIVILLRSAKQNAAAVARVLRQAGISCITSGRDALLDVPEVMDVRNVLTLLANRRQEVPLAAYLRSPMVGLSLAELLQIRAAAPRAEFCDAVAAVRESKPRDTAHCGPGFQPGALHDKLRAALARLDCWAITAREQELPELLRQIYHDTAWLLFAQALPGGEHRVALLRALERFAIDFARQGQHGVAEFDAYLEDLATAELDPGVPVSAGENVVRIMTIHAAKGLEFPVVSVLSAGSRFNQRRTSEALQCDETTGLGLTFFDYPARRKVTSARHPIAAQRGRAREIEEELRLLYVAATRARERLIICGHAKPDSWDGACAQFAASDCPPPLPTRLGATSLLDWVIMGAAAAGLHAAGNDRPAALQVTLHEPPDIENAVGNLFQSAAQEPPPATAATPADEGWQGHARRLLESPIDCTLAELPAVLSVSALKQLADGGAGSAHAVHDFAPRLPLPACVQAAAKPDGRELGTACHKFLQFADFAALASESAIRTEVDRLSKSARLSAEQAALIPVEDLAWFGATPLGRQLATHAAVARREVPFVHACRLSTAADAESIIIRGIIDCLLELDTGLVVLDYKTDRLADEAALRERVATYSVQLQLYAQAAAQIFARPVTRAALVFLRQRRVEDVPCMPLLLPDLLSASNLA